MRTSSLTSSVNKYPTLPGVDFTFVNISVTESTCSGYCPSPENTCLSNAWRSCLGKNCKISLQKASWADEESSKTYTLTGVPSFHFDKRMTNIARRVLRDTEPGLNLDEVIATIFASGLFAIQVDEKIIVNKKIRESFRRFMIVLISSV